MEDYPESLPRPWESLGAFIERTLIRGSRYQPPIFVGSQPAKRIGWLDSCRMPSRVHATQDDGETTICQHHPRACHEGGRWKIVESVPLKRNGRSAFCKTCFTHTTKSIPWVDPLIFGDPPPVGEP